MKTEKIELAGVIYKEVGGFFDGAIRFAGHFNRDSFDENGIKVTHGDTYLYICDHTIVADVPVVDTIQLQLNTLNAQEKELRAQFAARLMEITTQRNNLLALPNEAGNGD